MNRPLAFFDMEVYPNYVLCAFMTEGGSRYSWFTTTAEMKFPTSGLVDFIKAHTLITFNGTGFDIPLLMLCIRKEPSVVIKKASDRIILGNLKWWNFEKEFHVKCQRPEVDTIDIMEVAPLKGSLKMYAAKLHSYSIQDLPVNPSKELTPEEMETVKEYCFNDLLSTQDLYRALKAQLEMRVMMSRTYGIDLRSKSDAQMAEAIIKSEVEKLTKTKLVKPADLTGSTFKYRIPEWMQFFEIDILGDIQKAEFMVADTGKTISPPELEKKSIVFKNKLYKLGRGGLHSCEKQQVVRATATHMIIDVDVASYYPNAVLNQALYPRHIGPAYLEVCRVLVHKRLAEKARVKDLKTRLKLSPDAQPVLQDELKKVSAFAEGLKITVNGGTFGKLGSKYSVLYSPDLLIQVTVTGQLAVFMLIEMLGSLPDTEVVSANTDGVTVYCDRSVEPLVVSTVKEWETLTGFETERADYESIFARDVNNYVAIKTDHDVKAKGKYGKGLPLHKNPMNEICGDAVVDYLLFGADIEETVNLCDDIRKFISTMKVAGGAKFCEEPIGKVVRWYYSKESTDAMYYVTNCYTVPRTQGCKPLVILPLEIPEDLNREWYVQEAKNMVSDLGVTVS